MDDPQLQIALGMMRAELDRLRQEVQEMRTWRDDFPEPEPFIKPRARFFLNGRLTSVSGTTARYVIYKASDGSLTYDAGPMPDPTSSQYDDEEWYDLAHTFGDVHITRFG